jgi:CRISPR/Cas system CSM-associated protein Csm3 (group 7 of RAMP superfamily)
MSKEYYITGTIKLDTAVHIGSGKGHEPTDSPLRRRGDGEFFLSGRALAGSLRTLATRIAPRLAGAGTCSVLKKSAGTQSTQEKTPCGCMVCRLFGDVVPVDGSRASRLWVYDAPVQEQQMSHVRDGVGIDRRTGTAATAVKFDYEVMPADSLFSFRMRVLFAEDDDEKERVQLMQLLAATLAEWELGRGQIGAGTARGLGRFRFQSGPDYYEKSLTGAESIYQYLLSDKLVRAERKITEWPQQLLEGARSILQPRDEKGREQSVLSSFVQVKFTVNFTDPFLSNDPLAALLTGFDHAPLVEFITEKGLHAPVLSGSSLRGVLRSHGEKIMRTLSTQEIFDRENLQANFEHFKSHCPACDVLVSDSNAALASCDSRLMVENSSETEEEMVCLSCRLFGNQRRGSRLWVSDGRWANTNTEWLVQDFLAIDRFTGGGLDGAKFDAAPLLDARFAVDLMLHDPLDWELGLLTLLLRDMADGLITVGFGAAKGYGKAVATDFDWQVGYLDETDKFTLDAEGKHQYLFPKTMEGMPAGIFHLFSNESTTWLPDGWHSQAQTWVNAFNTMISNYADSSQLEPLVEDTFFSKDGSLAKLYGASHSEVKQS